MKHESFFKYVINGALMLATLVKAFLLAIHATFAEGNRFNSHLLSLYSVVAARLFQCT